MNGEVADEGSMIHGIEEYWAGMSQRGIENDPGDDVGLVARWP